MDALTLPVFGEWPGWMTVLVVGLVVLYVVQRIIHLSDRGPDDLSSEPLPGDMSTLAGWDEYVMGTRLERELGADGSDEAR